MTECSAHTQIRSVRCPALITHPWLQVPRALAPFTHAAAALAKGVACLEHDPQWAASVLRLTSQPLLVMPSQLSNLQ
jgi:hypothetical protein